MKYFIVLQRCPGLHTFFSRFKKTGTDSHKGRFFSVKMKIVTLIATTISVKKNQSGVSRTPDRFCILLLDSCPLSAPVKYISLLPSRQWLPRDKLLPMGIDDTVDKLRLMEGKKPSVRKSVHTAYDRAMAHLNHVRVNLNFNPSNFI